MLEDRRAAFGAAASGTLCLTIVLAGPMKSIAAPVAAPQAARAETRLSPEGRGHEALGSEELKFAIGGMRGDTEVSWDPAKSMLLYRARKGGRESWTRRPSTEEWSHFWGAMDRLAVWGWKQDYGEADHTCCIGWRVSLKHAGKSLSSSGCSIFPDRGWKEFVAEVERLRGGPEAATAWARELVKQLKEARDLEPRLQAVEDLADVGPGAAVAIPDLIPLLDGPDREPNPHLPEARLALAAFGALANIGEPAVAELAKALKHDNPNRRRYAAHTLAQASQSSRGAVPALTEALRDPVLVVRVSAARALVRIDPRTAPTVVPTVIEGLSDADPKTVWLSAELVPELGAAADLAVPALIRLVQDQSTRYVALNALDQMGPRAAPALPDIVKALSDKDEMVRIRARGALQGIGSPGREWIPALIDHLDNHSDYGVRVSVAYSLGAIGPEASQAVPSLVNALRYGEEYSLGSAASRALSQIGPPAVPALIAALQCDRLAPASRPTNPSMKPLAPEIESVRAGAARALSQMGPSAEAAIPALGEALRDESPRVRQLAAHALSMIQRR